MRAADIMSSPVITVRPDTPVRAATELLTAHGFTALPVTDDEDRLIGIVTEADLMQDRIIPDPRARLWWDRRETPRTPAPGTVGEVMTSPAMSMPTGADAADLAKVMLETKVRSIPILDDAKVVGIVTRRDLLRVLLRDDAALAEEVRQRLAAYDTGSRWTVSVREGSVKILDEFDNETDRHVAALLAQTVPSVQAVEVSSQVDETVGQQ